jgi:hypothetical protein
MLKSARIYASITDLPALSKYPEGWDPESTPTSYFINTSFLFGISVNF